MKAFSVSSCSPQALVRRLVLLGAAIGLLAGGCATAPTNGHGTPPGVVLIPAAKVNALAQGMNGARVTELLGAPHHKRPYPPGGAGAEIWSYRISSRETVTMVPVTMQSVPGYDPLTGQAVTRQEPVYQNQHIVLYQTLELLFMDGLLVQRTAGTDTERWFE